MVDVDDGGFSEELLKTGEVIDKELATITKVTLLSLEKDLTLENITSRLLETKCGKLLVNEVRRFVGDLRRRIRMSDLSEEEIKREYAAIADHVYHKAVKRALNELADRLRNRNSLLVALWKVSQHNTKTNSADAGKME